MPRADRDRHRQFKKTVTLKAVPHFKWASYYLPSKRSAKKQPALATFHHHFSSHSVLWHSRSHYPYSTHLVLMPIVEESGRLSSLFHCWKLGNLLVKLDLTIPSVLHHVLSNFWNAFLLIVFTASPKPKISSADSKPNCVKVGAVKIRLLG